MKLNSPKHWEEDGTLAKLLGPASFFYARATAKRVAAKGYRSKAKVICIGNVTAGGAGKTPTAIAIATMLQEEKKNVHFITTGFGRKTENLGAVRVAKQTAEEVGDEPLLLSTIAPTWVGENRAELAKAAENAGADVIIMDDGYQNGELEKDVSILVIDGGYGLGNGRVIPAGPLREPFEAALERADGVVIVGDKTKELPEFKVPSFKGKMELDIPENVKEEEVVAFCGIGRPEKFFTSLKEHGIKVVEELGFPDHHYYNETDFKAIFGIANSKKAVIVTTSKDMVKVPDRFRKIIYPVKGELAFDSDKKLKKLIMKKLGK